MFQLLYDGRCPYCRAISRAVSLADPAGFIDHVPIDSDEGTKLVKSWHDGEYVHAPHFRYGSRYAYGIVPVALRLLVFTPFIALAGIPIAVWRKIQTVTTRN